MMRLRHLRLRSFTSSRAFGADIPFTVGLNVLQAPNTSGKSTCLQAIIYALGLERALGPQLSIPLPYAMREQIHTAEHTPYESVLQSYVELEVENLRGDVLLVHRDVVGGNDTKLIQARVGKSGEDVRGGDRKDYFVLDGGAATHEAGFHKYLAEFIGWDLPAVARYDGTECPLYLEAIFPMLFVEQKRGWSAIQGPFPTFFRIQDVTRRVMEFLFDLDAARNRRKRAELRFAISEAVSRWTRERKFLNEAASRIGRLRGLSATPTPEFAISPEINLELYYEGEWQQLRAVVDAVKSRIHELEKTQIRSVEEVAPEIQSRISGLRKIIDAQSAVLEAVRAEYDVGVQEKRALEGRVRSLEADLRRNQDAQKLQKLGSSLGRAASEHICPTCHQDVTNELLPSGESVGMALDENIAFVKSQIELYNAALVASCEHIEEVSARYRGSERDLQDNQKQLRSLRQELTRPSASPSRAFIEEVVRLQAFVERLDSLDETALGLTDELREIAVEWAELSRELQALPREELTSQDRRKLEYLREAIRGHLDRYGFRSFQPGEITLSYDNFRLLALRVEKGEPVEKEINFEVSASDAIRLKWGFYLSCLELAAEFNVNHPGFLVFDEPGQQEIDSKDLFEFLRSAAKSAMRGQQVIVSTSEEFTHVDAELRGKANIVGFPAFILQPLVP